MSQSVKIQGMKLTISCEIPYTIGAGGSTDWEVTFTTPEWTVTGVLGAYSVTNTYTETCPSATDLISDLQADLETKINDVANTPIETATALMDVLQETLNSDTIVDSLDAVLNVEHKAAYALYSAFQVQIDASSGVYSTVTHPSTPAELQAGTNIITSNTTLTGAQGYSVVEQFLD